MDETNRCDRVALIQEGRLLAIDTPAAIAASFDRPLLAVRARDRYPLLRAIRAYPGTHTVYPFGEVLHYTDRRRQASPETIARELQDYLVRTGFPDARVAATAPTIEDSFMARMGAPASEER